MKTKVKLPDLRTMLLGFDAEYLTFPEEAGRENEPLCYQLHDGRHGHLMPLTGKLKLSDLTSTLMELKEENNPQAEHIVLASWFASAELSVLENDMDATLLLMGGGLFGLRWELVFSNHRRVRFTVYDLMALTGRKKLAEAGASVGLYKQHWDHSTTTRSSLLDRDFCAYAVNDALICYRVALDIHQEFSLSWGVHPFALQSVGHIGSSIFRHHYLTNCLMQPHPDVRELALIAYRGSGDFGGCWARGVMPGTWGEYDAVGMYPTSAALLRFLPTREDWHTWQSGSDWPETGLYRAQITWPQDSRRLLMAIVQGADGEDTYAYPRQAVDVWTGFELKAAERLGCEVRIISGHWYETGSDALPSFLSHLLKKRAQHAKDNLLMAGLYKNMANTIIGKLGQHKEHTGYSIKYDEATESGQIERNDRQYNSYGSMFAPEWWCLIVGHARAAMMSVIDEFNAVHCNVDAVLIESSVPEFKRAGFTFRLKSSGDTLRLAERNLWQLQTDGIVDRFAAGNGRDIPQLRKAFQKWTGKAMKVHYTVSELITIPLHAAHRSLYPLMTRREVKLSFTVPSLGAEMNEHGRIQEVPL